MMEWIGWFILSFLPSLLIHFVDIRSSQTSGIFLHNGAEQWIDTVENAEKNTTSAYFMVESAAFDLFILFGPKPKDVVRQITNLTGRAQVPQV